jgi:hypothetical protein
MRLEEKVAIREELKNLHKRHCFNRAKLANFQSNSFVIMADTNSGWLLLSKLSFPSLVLVSLWYSRILHAVAARAELVSSIQIVSRARGEP